MRTLFVLVLVIVTAGLYGQISFTESQSTATNNFKSGVSVVSIDMNGDTQDDLVRLNNGTELQVDLQHTGGKFFTTYQNLIADNPEWNLVAGDLNNDGWPDIVTSGIIDRVKVIQAIPFTNDYNISKIEDPLFFAQTANLIDADSDGFLDIFVCHEDGLNRLFLNDGAGGFVRNDTLIDFRTVPPSDNSGNYGSVWTDFDLDGDPDLYITKCKVGVFDPADPRRINVLYVNTDTGYVELADSFGLASGDQSWSSDFADIDNDGDLDIMVTNQDVSSILFENRGNGEYVDITMEAGLDIEGIIIQGIFRDFDNDGMVDLLVSGSRSKLFRNIGDNKFEEVTAPFGGENITSFTIGDFDHDGFPDVYTTFNLLYNTPSTVKDDKIWLNNGTENNFVRVKAIAKTGSSSAIGAKLLIYGAWGIQMREIRAGESYGIATSLIQNFGLGSAAAVDSLVVIWPYGNRESHSNIPVNATITVVEGGCVRLVESLGQGPFVQCGSDTFNIKAPDGFAAYLWSNGMNSQSIEVTKPGLYHVSLTEPGGCLTVTTSVAVMDNTENDEGEIEIEGASEFCFGESVTLTAPDGIAYVWNTGETTTEISVAETGTYTVTVTRSCFDVLPDPVVITIYNPNLLDVANDTIFGSGQGVLTAEGDSVNWYENPDDLVPIANGNIFTTPVVDTTTAYFAEQALVVPGKSYAIGMTEHLGGSKYNSEESNFGLIFDAMGDFRLDSVMTYTDFGGKRSIVLSDSSGAIVYRATVQIDSGVQWVPLGFDIPVGTEYLLTTDGDTNNAVFGVMSPQLVRSEEFVDYPYTVEDVASIKGTEVGEQFYFYFYNWQISSAPTYCIGEKRPVLLVVRDTSTSLIMLSEGILRAYPNPTSAVLNIEVDNSVDFSAGMQYTIRSLDGRNVRSGQWNPGEQISMRSLAPGIYNVELIGDGVLGVLRVVVVGER
jgi:ASPIC/UnbV protein/VCBS repeat protein